MGLLCTLVVSVCFVAFPLTSHAAAQKSAPKIVKSEPLPPEDPLTGLKEITVEVSVTPPDDAKSPALASLLRKPNVLPDSLQTLVELEIRRSTSLRVVPNAMVRLRVIITVSDLKHGNYYAIVRISLFEYAWLKRNAATVHVASWQSQQTHSWGGDSVVDGLDKDLAQPLNEFLNAYLAANPR